MDKKRPNIIVFMTDQQNATTIAPESPVKTPNLDEFYKNSVRFTDSYCPSPHCCPSRASFFTGLYPSQHGVWHNVEVDNAISRGVFENIKMFPQELQKNGYNTYFSGKWHVSAYEGPEDRGFTNVLREFISNYGRMEREYTPKNNDWDKVYTGKVKLSKKDSQNAFGKILREGYPEYTHFSTEDNPFGDTDTVDLACNVIHKYNSDEPFFIYVGTVGPHDPYNPPEEFLNMYNIEDIKLPDNFSDNLEDRPNLYKRTQERLDLTEDEHREALRRYYAFCSYEDYLFGKVLHSVKEKNILDDTIIIYLTDHGDYMGAHKLWAKGLPCFKEAYNICCVVGGGTISGNRVDNHLISLTDFAPTILEIADIKTDIPFAGKSLVPLIYNSIDSETLWRDEIHTQTNGNEIYGIQRAVWNKKYKYVFNSFDYDELYDLENDPGEMINLAKKTEYSNVVREMCIRMWKFAYKVKDANTCPYIMTSLAPYGPGIIFND